MAKGNGQKGKLLYLEKIFLEKTDENHGITVNEIIGILEKQGISAERKSIYSDIEILQNLGMDIISEKGKSYVYKLVGRDFEMPELKLLVDAVQSSKFITEKKSLELISKIETLCSSYEAHDLQRQVVVTNRAKTMNERIYYNTDTIHTAISDDKKIRFHYFEWAVNFGGTEKIIKRLRKDGDYYEVSPHTLTWDDENYYLICYDSNDKKIKHFRVDKMDDIKIMEDENRQGSTAFKSFDLAKYSKSIFGMFGGEVYNITMSFDNSMIGVVVDRLGKDIMISKVDDEHFKVSANIAVSPQFYGWLFGLGSKVKLLSPSIVIEQYKEILENVKDQY